MRKILALLSLLLLVGCSNSIPDGFTQSRLSILISDTKDPNTKEVYALVIVQVNHEKGRATYTLSFNTQYELVGLYLK